MDIIQYIMHYFQAILLGIDNSFVIIYNIFSIITTVYGILVSIILKSRVRFNNIWKEKIGLFYIQKIFYKLYSKCFSLFNIYIIILDCFKL